MESARLEKQADEKREEVKNSVRNLNRDLSPGRLLDELYFRGAEPGLSGYVKRIQEDPVPAALVAAAITWSGNREKIQQGLSSAKHKAEEAVAHGQRKAQENKGQMQQASEKLNDTAHQAQEKASESIESLKHSGERMAQRASEYSQSGYEQGQRMVHDHPWMNLAVGFSLGVSLGGMVPVSEREKEMMKPVAGQLKRAKDQAVKSIQEEIEGKSNQAI